MNRRSAMAWACATGALLSGCTASLKISGAPGEQPHCLQPYRGHPDHLDGSLVLAAQSVPGAALVPCVRQLPAGWSVNDFKAQRGRSRLWLDLGTHDQNAVTMTFTGSCDRGTARSTRSDEPGTRRYDEVTLAPTAYRGTRYYVFAGGCVTYVFDVRGAAATQAVRTISHALSFVDRDAIRRYVEAYSNGRVHLDPSPGG
jgi:hypothetical protein